MKRFISLLLIFLLSLCGCSKQGSKIDKQTPNTSVQIENQTNVGASANSEQSTPSETETTESTNKEIVAPTRDEVYATREQALKGMTEEQIDDLTEFVKRANLWLEQNYMYDNFFELLGNPDHPVWNYFHQTGEIQTGWAYDGNLDIGETCRTEELSENEFYAKYGTPVCETNTYDADGFAAAIASLKSNVQNEDLNNILQYIADESLLAKDTHDVVHVNSIYRTLHDLDYFLLRYGVEDVGSYVTDTSTVAKFYGTLPCYK